MKVYIATLGCKLNQFESEAIGRSLRLNGLDTVKDMDKADTVLVHTCTVTAKADSKSRNTMRKAKRLGKYVVVAGCYANTDGDMLEKEDYIDLVLRDNDKYRLADYLLDHEVVEKDGEDFPAVTSFERTRAFVKIQDGCDKFCSYCKIPFARGRSHSLSPEKVIQQVKELIERGYKELVITGVNISDYKYEGVRLSALLGKILKLDGDFRLRLSSLQPDEFEPEMIGYLSHPKFAKHFHLSLQSGSTGVLSRMNRKYDREYFIKLVRDIRKACPECGVTSDIIVGFPGENDAEFAETLALVEEVSFNRVHLFAYSPREGTRAAKMKDINGNIKREREAILRERIADLAETFVDEQMLGEEQVVLVEKVNDGCIEGYTSNYIRVTGRLEGAQENTFVNVIPNIKTVDNDGVVGLGF